MSREDTSVVKTIETHHDFGEGAMSRLKSYVPQSGQVDIEQLKKQKKAKIKKSKGFAYFG